MLGRFVHESRLVKILHTLLVMYVNHIIRCDESGWKLSGVAPAPRCRIVRFCLFGMLSSILTQVVPVTLDCRVSTLIRLVVCTLFFSAPPYQPVCGPYGAVVCTVNFQSRGCAFNYRRLWSHTHFFSFSFPSLFFHSSEWLPFIGQKKLLPPPTQQQWEGRDNYYCAKSYYEHQKYSLLRCTFPLQCVRYSIK